MIPREPGERRVSWRHPLATVIALLAIFAAGWLLGGRHERAQTGANARAAAKTPSAPAPAPLGKAASNNPKWDENSPLARALSAPSLLDRTEAVLALIKKTPVKDLAALIEQAGSMPRYEERYHIRELIFAQWVTSAPAEALTYALSMKHDDSEWPYAVLAMWTETDPKGALDIVLKLKLPDARTRFGGFDAILVSWAKTDPVAAWAAAQNLLKSQRGYVNVTGIFSAWGSRDPDAALKTALALKENRARAVDGAICGLAEVNVDAAIATFRSLNDKKLQETIVNSVAFTIAIEDAAAAYRFLRESDISQSSVQTWKPVFEQWLKQDRQAAMQAIESFPTLYLQTELWKEALSSLNYSEPELAAKLYLSLDPKMLLRLSKISFFNPARMLENMDLQTAVDALDKLELSTTLERLSLQESGRNAYEIVLRRLAVKDPAAAIAKALTLPAGKAQESAVNEVVSAWAGHDLQAALDWVQATAPGKTRDSLEATIFEQLARNDPVTAAARLDELPASVKRNEYIESVAAKMAEDNLDDALAWLTGHASGETLADGIKAIIFGGGRPVFDEARYPALAAAIVEHIPPEFMDPVTIEAVTNHWMADDPKAAMAWIETLPADSKLRETALIKAIDFWSRESPGEAAAYLNQAQAQIRPLEFAEILREVAPRFAQEDPAAALAWAQTLPEGKLRDEASGLVVSVLAEEKPAVAWELAQQLPEGNARANTLVSVLSSWAENDPSRAASLLQTIAPGEKHEVATIRVFDNWLRQDEPAAVKWFDGLPRGPDRDVAASMLVSYSTKLSKDPEAQMALAMSIADHARRADAIKNTVPMYNVTVTERAQAIQRAIQAVQASDFTEEERMALLKDLKLPGEEDNKP